MCNHIIWMEFKGSQTWISYTHTHTHIFNNTEQSLVDSAWVYWQAYDSSLTLQLVDIATVTMAQTLNMRTEITLYLK